MTPQPSAKLKVHVTPRSSRMALQWHNDHILAWVHEPPTEGLVNQALIELLSKTLKIPKKSITLEKGFKSRDKTFKIEGLTLENIEQILRLI
jgi:uncharacterized protein YggU (UPF0235/DUF167 family)